MIKTSMTIHWTGYFGLANGNKFHTGRVVNYYPIIHDPLDPMSFAEAYENCFKQDIELAAKGCNEFCNYSNFKLEFLVVLDKRDIPE